MRGDFSFSTLVAEMEVMRGTAEKVSVSRFVIFDNVQHLVSPTCFSFFQISWIRGRDSHILSVDNATFVSDRRIRLLRPEGQNEWNLHIRWVRTKRRKIFSKGNNYIFWENMCVSVAKCAANWPRSQNKKVLLKLYKAFCRRTKRAQQ